MVKYSEFILLTMIFYGLLSFSASYDTDGIDKEVPPKKKKCGFVDFFKGKCESWPGSNLKPQYLPTTTERPPTPAVNPWDDKSSSFNFGAFIIALFTSLIIALSGAFACWCCRTFLQQRAYQNHLSEISPTLSLPMESLDDEAQLTNQNRQIGVIRSNSLPPYSSVEDKTPVATTSDEPPPTYLSLFGATAEGNKS